MASTLFRTTPGKLAPAATGRNSEGAPAYVRSPQEALAQYVSTGCLNSTFYASAEDQLETLLTLAQRVDAAFLAKAAIYSRETAFLKDAPALLCAVLSVVEPVLLPDVFRRVIDDGKMLRTFVQIVRSGAIGRKSLGSLPKKLVAEWLETRSDRTVFHASVGATPSLADVVKMAHPRPKDAARRALYGYLIGKDVNAAELPPEVTEFEEWKAGRTASVPDVPFQMLTGLELPPRVWKEIARNASWQTTRMNLNTFARHGVFEDAALTGAIVARLRNREAIGRARAFPYQLLAAAKAASPGVPAIVTKALEQAMELAIANVPALEGKVYVCPDVSGSMRCAVTGYRKGSTSSMRCVDVAALMAASIVRKNRGAEVLPFEQNVVPMRLDPEEGVMRNAQKLAAVGGGGTSCSAPLALLNQRKARGETVVFVSDNESWVDARRPGATAMMTEWSAFKARNPQAKLVCIDLVPSTTTQAAEREDVLNVGGFSDAVFGLVADFAAGRMAPGHWVSRIEEVTI